MGGKKSNHIRRSLSRLRSFQTWQLVIILIPAIFATATLLRFDHLKMVELRSAVLGADAAEDDEKIASSLETLHEFVVSHIIVNISESNGEQSIIFGTGPFYLKQQYLRAANAAIEEAESRAADDTNPNGNIYAEVSSICRPIAIANQWTWDNPGYLNCWTEELAKYPEADDLDFNLVADVPSTELFRYDYASPVWAPTFSGFAILICVILISVILVRGFIWCALHISLLFLK